MPRALVLIVLVVGLIGGPIVGATLIGSCSCGDPGRTPDAAVCHVDAAPADAPPAPPDAPPVDARVPADATVDAPPPVDAAPDATPGIDAGNATPCASRGDGRDGAQCCAWDPAACRAGLGCYWMPGNETGPEDALCVSPNGTLGVDQVCEYERFMDCRGGTFCIGLTNQDPNLTTGFCRLICDPHSTNSGCPAGESCDVITSNPTIGFCGGNL